MKEITLGTIVSFNQISSVEYIESTKKEIIKHKLKTSFSGMVIGKIKKATGKYDSGHYENHPRLIVDKYHSFYEVRSGLTNKSFMVHPDDIKVVEESKVNIPNKNDLVFDENQVIHIEGNGGGDFVRIEEIEEGLLKIECGSGCVYNHNGIYPTEYLTKILEYAKLNLTPEKIFDGWNKDYVEKLKEKINEGYES